MRSLDLERGKTMDLTTAAVGLQQAKTMGEVQVRVAKKIMDVDRMNGDAAIKLIEAATSGVGQAGSAMVAAATGLGGSLDVQA